MFLILLLYAHSYFEIILMEAIESWLLCLVCLPVVSRDCCVAISLGAMGLSAVCDCDIYRSYSLTIFWCHSC